MKRLLIAVLIIMIIPCAFAEPTEIRNIYEFTDQYNKYLYECIDEFGFDATHNLVETVYMSSNGVVKTSAGMFFIDSSDGITYCGFGSSGFKSDNETDTFIYRTISAITALEYSPSDLVLTEDPLMDTLTGQIYTSIVIAIDKNAERIKENGNSGIIASGNYDYIVNYIESIDEFAVSAQMRDS